MQLKPIKKQKHVQFMPNVEVSRDRFSTSNLLDDSRSRARMRSVFKTSDLPQIDLQFAEWVAQQPMIKEAIEILGEHPECKMVETYGGTLMPLNAIKYRLLWSDNTSRYICAFYDAINGIVWNTFKNTEVATDLGAVLRKFGLAEALRIEKESLESGEKEYASLTEAIVAYICPKWQVDLNLKAGLPLAFNKKRKVWVLSQKGQIKFKSPQHCWEWVQANTSPSAESLFDQVNSATRNE